MKLSLAFTALATSAISAVAFTCDFCPEPADLLGDDGTCDDLLRMARAGTLYTNEQDCNFNIPILADRCLCSIGPEPVYDPCDPCDGKKASSSAIDLEEGVNTAITYSSMTIAKVSGNIVFPFSRNGYSCVETLYSARKGGLSPAQCEFFSEMSLERDCGGCIETMACEVDSVCPENQKLVAINSLGKPGFSNVWPTALVCQDLVQQARAGTLLSESGCSVFLGSTKTALQSGNAGIGLSDLTDCEFLCIGDDDSVSFHNEQVTGREQIQGREDVTGEVEVQGRDQIGDDTAAEHRQGRPTGSFEILQVPRPTPPPTSAEEAAIIREPSVSNSPSESNAPSESRTPSESSSPSTTPSTSPSSTPSSSPSESNSPSESPSDVPSSNPTFAPFTAAPFETKAPVAPSQSKECANCEESGIFYYYKDFGLHGTTFSEAILAPTRPGLCEDDECCCDTDELFYPDLEHCFLTDVNSPQDLIAIQAVVPQHKAAFTAVSKDPSTILAQVMECDNIFDGIISEFCEDENYKHGLIYGFEKPEADEDVLPDPSPPERCPVLKEGWTNYASAGHVPSNVWNAGQPSFCLKGPIQQAGAVWAFDGTNLGELKDVSGGWYLPGAVYKCCFGGTTCFAPIPIPPPTPAPTKPPAVPCESLGVRISCTRDKGGAQCSTISPIDSTDPHECNVPITYTAIVKNNDNIPISIEEKKDEFTTSTVASATVAIDPPVILVAGASDTLVPGASAVVNRCQNGDSSFTVAVTVTGTKGDGTYCSATAKDMFTV